jgi:hypothetical protein
MPLSSLPFLHWKVKWMALEEMVKTMQQPVQAVTVPTTSPSSDARATADARESNGNTEQEDKESLTQILNDWKKGMEGQQSNIQEEWNQEGEVVQSAREDWGGKVQASRFITGCFTNSHPVLMWRVPEWQCKSTMGWSPLPAHVVCGWTQIDCR